MPHATTTNFIVSVDREYPDSLNDFRNMSKSDKHSSKKYSSYRLIKGKPYIMQLPPGLLTTDLPVFKLVKMFRLKYTKKYVLGELTIRTEGGTPSGGFGLPTDFQVKA